MESFSFGVLTYNQENMIVETLDSILYQVIRYGKGIKVALYIIDDASNDNTVEIANKWIKKNKDKFEIIEIIVNQKNQGIVNNYNILMENITSSDFKIIAGDDLISSTNLFNKSKALEEKELHSYVRLELCDGKLSYNDNALERFYYNQKYKKSRQAWLKEMRKGGFFHTPSTIFKRCLYDVGKCKEFNSLFFLYEDDPTWYSMLKNVEDIKVVFISDVIVLYRVHSHSVSNVKLHGPFADDIRKLNRIYMQDSKGSEKIIKWFKSSNLPKFLRLDKYVDFVQRKYIHWKVNNQDDFKLFVNQMEIIRCEEQKFYDKIKLGEVYDKVFIDNGGL